MNPENLTDSLSLLESELQSTLVVESVLLDEEGNALPLECLGVLESQLHLGVVLSLEEHFPSSVNILKEVLHLSGDLKVDRLDLTLVLPEHNRDGLSLMSGLYESDRVSVQDTLVPLLEQSPTGDRFNKKLSIDQIEGLSNETRDPHNDPIDLLLKPNPIIINHLQMRMTQPLVKSLKIKSPGLLDSLASMLVGLTAVELLGSQSSSRQMNDQIIPRIGDIVHRPELILEDGLLVILSAVGEVITDSSVADQNDVSVLQLGQLSEVPLSVHLLLADQPGDASVRLVAEVARDDIGAGVEGHRGYLGGVDDQEVSLEGALDAGDDRGLAATGTPSNHYPVDTGHYNK